MWKTADNINFDVSNKSLIMAILNVTPDSFSDGGLNYKTEDALRSAQLLFQEGADILDIGGESTRPDASPITPQEEQARILPVLKKILAHKPAHNRAISVDTYNSSTALLALKAGVNIINDVFGLQYDSNMASVVADYGAGIVIMHTNRKRIGKIYDDVIDDQFYFFEKSLEIAHKAGIKDEYIILDPGFGLGFGKDLRHNIELFKRAHELQKLNYPLLAGTSRKTFLGEILDITTPQERDIATMMTSILLRSKGFCAFRVHNVALNRQALDFCTRIEQS